MASKVDPEDPGPWKTILPGAKQSGSFAKAADAVVLPPPSNEASCRGQPACALEDEGPGFGLIDDEEETRMPLCGHLYVGPPSKKDAGKQLPNGKDASGSALLPVVCSAKAAVVTGVTAIWWIAAVYVTAMFKVATLALPPFTLTWLVNTSTGVIAMLLSLIMDHDSPPLPEMQWEECIRLAALGLAQGCEFGCLNKSLQYLTVSERTMLQNINILLLMATAWVCGLEKMSVLRVVACFFLASGGLLQGLDSSRGYGNDDAHQAANVAHVKGIAFMVTSMLLTAGKWSLVQIITQRSDPASCLGRISKLQLAARVQPVTGVVCLGLAGLFEARTLTLEHLLLSGVLVKVPLIAAGITVIQCTELKLVQLTSAVAVGVLMNLHHIPMVLAGVILFHDDVDSLGLAGFGCCSLGGLFYAGAQYVDSQLSSSTCSRQVNDKTEPLSGGADPERRGSSSRCGAAPVAPSPPSAS